LSNLVGEMPAGAVDLGGSIQAASAGYSAVDAMAVTIVRLYHEAEELRAEVAMQQQQARILAEERDEAREAFAIATNNCVDAQKRLREMERELNEARVQYRSTEALSMALVKTIDELKTEKAELVVKLVNLQGRSRRATLDEIAESVREKYDERYEGEGMDNE
jgi:chromosome segregation ATPase